MLIIPFRASEERAQAAEERASLAETELKRSQERIMALERRLPSPDEEDADSTKPPKSATSKEGSDTAKKEATDASATGKGEAPKEEPKKWMNRCSYVTNLLNVVGLLLLGIW